jgi:hypothetical protein
VVSPVHPVDGRIAARRRDPIDHHHVLDGRAVGDGNICGGLQQSRLAPAPTAIGGDQHLAFGVVDAVSQGVGGEPAEHHGVGRAETGTCQHRDRELEHHRQVDGDPIALGDAQPCQHVGESLHLGEQLAVGDGPGVARLPLPVEGHPVAVSGDHVAIEAVLAHVELAAHEPASERELPLADRVPRLLPVQQVGGLAAPEPLHVVCGLIVELAGGDQRSLLERRRRREVPLLVEVVLDGGGLGLNRIGHGGSPLRRDPRGGPP